MPDVPAKLRGITTVRLICSQAFKKVRHYGGAPRCPLTIPFIAPLLVALVVVKMKVATVSAMTVAVFLAETIHGFARSRLIECRTQFATRFKATTAITAGAVSERLQEALTEATCLVRNSRTNASYAKHIFFAS